MRAETYVRDRVAGPLTKEDAARLRTYVAKVVSDVDEICFRHDTVPSRLPSPSRKAYEYLKAVTVRARSGPARTTRPSRPTQRATRPKPPVSMRNVVRLTQSALNTVSDLAGDMAAENVCGMVRPYVNDSVRMIADACRKQGGAPADLPAPSRNAYGMLAFLAEDDVLARYVEAVATIKRLLAGKKAAKGLLVRLDDQRGIYHLRRRGNDRFFRLNPGFLAADEHMLSIVVDDAFDGRNAERWREVHSFVHCDEFREIRQQIEAGLAGGNGTRGAVYDLTDVCRTVIGKHFDGDLAPPASLGWTQGTTFRTFGHYSSVLDRVTLSRSLDSARVPPYVVEFVMYHELLHKAHGIGLKDSGRRAMHTPAFRRDEKKHPRYAEAKEFISRLSAAMRG